MPPSVSGFEIDNRRVRSDSVIPKHNGPGSPSDSRLKVDAKGNVVAADWISARLDTATEDTH